MHFSESNVKISVALAKAWGKIETPKHNRDVTVTMKDGKGKYTFSYTDLGGILDAVRPALKEHGLAVLQNAYTRVNEHGKNEINVETMLLHESGEWVKSDLLTFQAAFGMQDLGGQISYLKRYSLSALLGLSTDKDDDANGVSGQTTTDNKQPPKNQSQNRGQNQPPPQTNSTPPPGADIPPTGDEPKAPPKAITSGQITKIEMILSGIGKAEDKKRDDIWKLYQMKIKRDLDYKTLTSAQASRLIDTLNKILENPVTLYEA